MKLLRKVLVCTFFSLVFGLNSYANTGSNITYASVPLETHAVRPLKNIPVKLKVDMTLHYTWNGFNCSAHITGYVIMDFDPKNNVFTGILEQQLTSSINCKGKLIDLILREASYDGRQFTSVMFEESEDEDMNFLLGMPEFNEAFLAALNASLTLSK